jgi:hypothetical protein
MAVLGLGKIQRPRIGQRVTIRNDRDRRHLIEYIREGLTDLTQRERDGCEVIRVQLLVQVCSSPGYQAWRDERERAWLSERESLAKRRKPGGWTTRTWPALIPEEGYGVLLLPIRPGRVGLAAGVGRLPMNISSPLFTSSDGDPSDAILGAVASWVCSPGDGSTARVAPPVIDIIHRGLPVKHRVEDYGLTWHLPAPDIS